MGKKEQRNITSLTTSFPNAFHVKALAKLVVKEVIFLCPFLPIYNLYQ